MDASLQELVDLLSCRALSPDVLQAKVEEIRAAVENPAGDQDTAFLAEGDHDEQERLEAVLFLKLMDEFVVDDRFDLLHARMSDLFETPLPSVPTAELHDLQAYACWLDEQLAAREGRRYAAIEVRCWLLGDELCVCLPLHEDVPRIIDVADGLGLAITHLGELPAY